MKQACGIHMECGLLAVRVLVYGTDQLYREKIF